MCDWVHVYDKTVTTNVSAGVCITPLSCHFFFFFVVRLFKTYSLGNFQVYNAVLLMTITMLHIRSLELISLLTEFINLPQPQPRQTTSPCRCEFAFLRLHI